MAAGREARAQVVGDHLEQAQACLSFSSSICLIERVVMGPVSVLLFEKKQKNKHKKTKIEQFSQKTQS